MKVKKNNGQFRETLKGLITGSIVASDFLRKQIPYILLLFVLGLAYISNRYHAESVFIETEKTKKEIEDLRAQKIEIQAKLMKSSRINKVIEKLRENNSTLIEPKSPHQKIEYKIEIEE